MAIGSATIVYVIAEAGTGKSFSGDYLDVVHGFRHIDGDIPLKNVHLPKYRAVMKQLTKAMVLTSETGSSPEELWHPYFDVCASLTLETAERSDRVVFTHASAHNTARDYFVKKLVEGGAKRENIILVQLTVNPDVKYRGLYYRTLTNCANGGVTMEDVCRTWGWEFEGDMTADKFVECSKSESNSAYFKDSEKSFEVCPGAIKVDVSGRDITHLDNIDEALDLRRPSEWTYEGICDKVKPIDEQRDRDMIANGCYQVLEEITPEVMKELNPDAAVDEDGAKVDSEEVKSRRTSIVKVELINGRQLSDSSIKEVRERRSTLIFQGKLDLNLEE